MKTSFDSQAVLEVAARFTEVRKNNGILTKIIRIDADGVLIKDGSQCWLSDGKAESKEIPFADFPEYLRSLSQKKAIIHGIMPGDNFKVLSCKKYSGEPGTITRTKPPFKYPDGPGLTMFDYDPGPGQEALSRKEFISLISSVFPEFAEAATVWTPSTSACIYDQSGREIKGIGDGFHLYFVAANASDLPRFADVLFKRLWLAGHGYIFITKSGAQIPRTIFDKTVFSPERLDFVAGADCEDGLEQRLPMPEYTAGGYLDTTLLPDLIPEEEARFKELVDDEKRKTAGEAEARKAEYVRSEVDKLAVKGSDRQQAERIVTQRIGGDLVPGDILYFDDFGAVDVADVLKDPKKYDKCTLRDPVEPEYGGGHRKAMFYANEGDNKPVIHSFAHGEQKYFLHKDTEDQRNTIIERALKDAQVDPGAPYEKDILEALQAVNESNPADYMRYRGKFKEANRNISVTRLDKLVESCAQEQTDSKADDLVALIKEQTELFHNPDKECFATFEQDGHRETYPINSQGFEEWAGYMFFKSRGRAAGEATIRTALSSLSGIAKFEGSEQQTFLRAAKHGDGYIIDLCTPDWKVVHVTSEGWAVLSESPVKFWRTNTMQPLPVPKENGDISLLWKHVNIHKEDRPFLVAWMLEAFRPDTPFAIAEAIGGQGTAKSTFQNCVRSLVDPNAVNLRTAPKNVEDVFVGASNNWLASYDNLSRISSKVQDAFCSLATGGGFATRKLYTNMDESVTDTKRPIIFNGISQLATRQDLVDRVIHFDLEEIPAYKEESKLKEEFAEHRSSIFGGILNLFSKTLKKLPEINIAKPPRMADFARLGEAMSQSEGRAPGAFLSGYEDRRQQAVVNALDSSPVALAVQEFMDRHPEGFKYGLVKALLRRLSEYRPDGEGWPRSPRGLSDILRRNQPGLKAVGIKVIFHKRNKNGVHISLAAIPSFHEENNCKKRCTPHTPSEEYAKKNSGLSGVHCKNQRTPDVHPADADVHLCAPDVHRQKTTYTPERPANTGDEACGVHGVCHFPKLSTAEKKDTPYSRNTPDDQKTKREARI